jgi:aspartyl-tRNA(Asn)/glutamyl-tRNA(Gln) amidotransferase subunit A
MSEFAFTGLGLNPHFPPLGNPYDRGCAPGGSSGGAAVSVALGQCAGAIGTDTGGSVRIPAAFCGLTGFKPTQSRIPRSGVTPLSPSLDSIGPIANTVRCCAVLDAVMAGGSSSPGPAAARSLRLATPQQEVLEGLDPEVAAAFERALASLSSGGHQIAELNFPELSAIFTLNARGGLSNAEAFAWHRRRGFLEHPTLYDPNVLTRIKLGEGLSAGDYLDLLEGRRSLIAAADARTAPFDALIWPTTPILAPRLDRLASPDAFSRLNGLALRNTSIANFLDRCAISVPMQAEGAPPCGLMIMGERLQDERLLSQAQTIAAVIKAAPAA